MENKKLIAVIVLAAGLGKRMNNPNLPKVIAELKEHPLIHYVVKQVTSIYPNKIVIIVGHKKETVIDYLNNNFTDVEFAVQEEQLGTGHAVMQTASKFENYKGSVLILAGDVPLLQYATISNFIMEHLANDADLSVLSTIADDPKDYGRIIRNKDFEFVKIVEEKDASEEEKQVIEINSGIFMVNSKLLFESLKQVKNSNSQGEYYLTDIVEIIDKNKYKVFAYPLADFEELQGVNSPEDLTLVEKNFDKFYEKE